MPNNVWQVSLGRQIREARETKGVLQQELAKALGRKRETVRLYEAGEVAPPLAAMRVIVEVLKTEFNVDGCVISPTTLPQEAEIVPPAEQMPLDFDYRIVYRRAVVSVRATPQTFVMEARSSE